jgi:Uma2 family endonuclease
VAATQTKLMTFAEFEKLPEPKGGRHELRNGEVALVAPPKHRHHLIQRRLLRLLGDAAGAAGEVSIEFGYRPLPEYHYWIADVVLVSRERWDNIPLDGYFSGVPDLVVEVLSPSNTTAEIQNKKKLCLANGAREFWVVDTDHRQVEVSTPDGHTLTYKSGQEIPLFFAPGARLAVDAIFA